MSNKEEWEIRFVIYQANVEYIGCKKSQKNSYNLTDNKFADLTNEEFVNLGEVNGIKEKSIIRLINHVSSIDHCLE
ncbi:hypothetical protein JHK86_016792 [Glycine max]|nr:hypothetical protein JHK86_016792 [Glycine max]